MDAKTAIELLHKDTYHLTNGQARQIAALIESLAADAELGSRAKNIYKACLDCTKNNEPDDVKVRRVEAFIDNELVLYRLRAGKGGE